MKACLLVIAGALVTGCTSAESTLEVDCATATVPTYAELGDALAYCASCHGASVQEQGIRYDTYAQAKQNAAAGAEEVESGTMPENTDMPTALAQQLVTWAQCGTPE